MASQMNSKKKGIRVLDTLGGPPPFVPFLRHCSMKIGIHVLDTPARPPRFLDC